MRHTITQLEELFSASKADDKVLKQLEDELRFRSVPRAISLLTEVQAVRYGATPVPRDATAAPRDGVQVSQGALFAEGPTSPSTGNPSQPKASAPRNPPELKGPPISSEQDAAFIMSEAEAYRVLKLAPGAPWETIERSRRELVQQAHPNRLRGLSPEKSAQVRAEAQRVNAAYLSLCAKLRV